LVPLLVQIHLPTLPAHRTGWEPNLTGNRCQLVIPLLRMAACSAGVQDGDTPRFRREAVQLLRYNGTMEGARFFLDGDERAFLREALGAVQRAGLQHGQGLYGEMQSLAQLAALIQDIPGIAEWVHGTRPLDSGEALVALCSTIVDYDKELHLPTKAMLGQAYGLAKIHFLENTAQALVNVRAPVALQERAWSQWARALHGRMAEEILISIAMDAQCAHDARVDAGRILFHIWEERLHVEVDDFAPVLESAWQARRMLRPVLGTMLGASELMRLFQLAKDDRLLSYFAEDDVPEEQTQAFQEFIFGLSHESIQLLRLRMGEKSIHALSFDDAKNMLGIQDGIQFQEVPTPQALYTSYRMRRVKAQARTLTGVPGPKKTAEEYAMGHLLQSSNIAAKWREPVLVTPLASDNLLDAR